MNSTPGPSKAENLTDSGEKKSGLPPEERFLELIQKQTLFHYIVGQAMFLKDYIYQRFRRTCIYGNQGLIDNLRAESS